VSKILIPCPPPLIHSHFISRFHAFTLSIIVGFAGGIFGFIWLGKPSAMLSNDLNMASCIVAFVLVNYSPLEFGYRVLDTLPLTIVTTSWAQLFRSLGLMKFVKACFNEFKGNPSPYYPIPVFGPILYGTVRQHKRLHTRSSVTFEISQSYCALQHAYANSALMASLLTPNLQSLHRIDAW
jgi:hypothetical protein